MIPQHSNFSLKEVAIYYPADNQTLRKGLIEVKCVDVKSEQTFVERKLRVSYSCATSVSSFVLSCETADS